MDTTIASVRTSLFTPRPRHVAPPSGPQAGLPATAQAPSSTISATVGNSREKAACQFYAATAGRVSKCCTRGKSCVRQRVAGQPGDHRHQWWRSDALRTRAEGRYCRKRRMMFGKTIARRNGCRRRRKIQHKLLFTKTSNSIHRGLDKNIPLEII